MSFVKSLLTKLANLPPEEREAVIAEEVANAKATPAEMSDEITNLFAEVYGDGDGVTSDAVEQLELLGEIAGGIETRVQEQAEQAARAQEIGQRIESLKRGVEATEQTIEATKKDATDGKADPEEPSEGADDGGSGGEEPPKDDAPEGDEAGADDGGKPSDDAPPEDGKPGEDEEEAKPKKGKPKKAEPDAPSAPKTSITTPQPAAPAPTPPELATSVNHDSRIPLGQMPTDRAPDAPKPEKFESFSLIAAADVPGFSTGQSMDGGLGDVAHAWENRMSPMITGNINNGRDGERTRVGIARVKRQLPEQFTVHDERNTTEVMQKVEHACDETRLPGGSLTASAGWCAPSETLYDLCPIRMTNEGLISLPQIQTKRGGIKYPADFDWAAVWSSIGFELTEEEVIAGTEKNCVEVPCPTEWQECRMDVAGLCIRTPILMERGWPERVEHFFEGALLVHAHKMNARKLAKMEALSERIVIPGPRPGANDGDPIVDAHGPGATESLLSILELQVQYQRYRARLSQSGGTLEMVAPFWVRGILKSDLRKKLGIDNRWSISNAQIDGYLRNVGVNPQYVYDWQDSFEHPMNPSGFGGPIPLRWPDKVKLMLYPSGTFFELNDDVINLDGVYDHASLIQNVYTGLFTEEGWQVCKRCLDSFVIELDLCANGLSGTHIGVTCDELPPPNQSVAAAAGSCAS